MDQFFHYGRLFGFRAEHGTPRQAIEAGAVYEIAEVEGYSSFHDTMEVLGNYSHLIGEHDRIKCFVETSDGSLLDVQDIYTLEALRWLTR